MPAKLTWTPQALQQLEVIYFTLGIPDETRAERICKALLRRTELLRDFPYMGVRRPDIHPNARMLVEKPYLILYEVDVEADTAQIQITVVALYDGRRNMGRTP